MRCVRGLYQGNNGFLLDPQSKQTDRVKDDPHDLRRMLALHHCNKQESNVDFLRSYILMLSEQDNHSWIILLLVPYVRFCSGLKRRIDNYLCAVRSKGVVCTRKSVCSNRTVSDSRVVCRRVNSSSPGLIDGSPRPACGCQIDSSGLAR